MKDSAHRIVKKLQSHGYQAVYAGGCVRDMIMGNDPCHDYDIATSATPDVVESLFEKTLPVGKAFGVIVVILDDVQFEVATFRTDSATSDGRRPDSVTFSSMEEDAHRRDLTINGMFYDPVKDEVIDCVRGHEDLHNKVIRLIGDPEARIAEDRLRMLRVVRFAARLDFRVDQATLDAVRRHAAEITAVSAERIADELTKILRAGNFRKALGLLFETGLVDHILPEVKAMKGCAQPADYHPEGDVFEHTIKALENLPNGASDELRWGVLLHDVGKPPTQTFEDRFRFNGHDLRGKDIAREIMARMRFSNEFSDRVLALVANHMKFMCVKEMRTSRLKRFMALPYFNEHMMLHRADCLSSHGSLENYDFVSEKLKTYEPEEIRPVRIVTGHDLIEFGLVPGVLFKQILTDVEDQQLEGVLTDRDSALEYVKSKWLAKTAV